MTPVPLTWCDQCSKFTVLHLLIHSILRHAPRLGDRRHGQRNWRTDTLTNEHDTPRAA